MTREDFRGLVNGAAPDVFAELGRLIAEAPREDLPELVGRLVEAEERARLRLRTDTTSSAPQEPAEPERMLTPEEAALAANVPVKRIYTWARGQRWASRPSRKCLRIREAGFRRWLSARA